MDGVLRSFQDSSDALRKTVRACHAVGSRHVEKTADEINAANAAF